jgi:hypothetical protein
MRKLLCCMALAGILGAAHAASAATLFSDNFNNENGGVTNGSTLNYTGFANWTVTNGTVDLIGNGYFDFLPGNGLYVDMDGSTDQAGTIVSKPIALGAGTYQFQFDLAGNQRNDSIEPVTASVSGGLASHTYCLTEFVPFTQYDLDFTISSPQTVMLGFSEVGGSNIGMLLDNVSLSSVGDDVADRAAPAPSAVWGGLMLMGGLAAMKIRNKHFA